MTRLDHEREVIDLAKQLGIEANSPLDGILDHCHRRITRWVQEAGGVTDIAALEALVTKRLDLVFEEVKVDDDFDRIADQYARGKNDPVFASIRFRFSDDDNPTFGVLIQRRNIGPEAADRFVAVIDCRRGKLARRFFTKWHEIAHRLTTHADGGDGQPAYRSEHDPIERLMDEIAGRIGFYGPLFEPAFNLALAGTEQLAFETVEVVRRNGFSEASFQSTLCACCRTLPAPVVYLEAMLGHKASVGRKIADKAPRLFALEDPLPELRAVRVVANESAKQERFVIPQNMRVPESSVIQT